VQKQKSHLPVHQVDGLNPTEIFCSRQSVSSPAHRSAKQSANQGTLASPSQVAAPVMGTPDARDEINYYDITFEQGFIVS